MNRRRFSPIQRLARLLAPLAGLGFCLAHGASVDELGPSFASAPLALEMELERFRCLASHLNQPAGVRLKVDGQDWDPSRARLRMTGPGLRGQDKPEFLLELRKSGGADSAWVAWSLDPSAADGSYLEQYCGARLAELCQLPCLRIGHAKVLLNHRDYGLYVLKEGVSNAWLKRQFGHNRGMLLNGAGRDIDEPLEAAFDGGSGGLRLQDELAAACLIENLAARDRSLEDTLDIQAFIQLMAFESVFRHGGGYSEAVQNYKLHLDPRRLKAVFIPDGFDLGFAGPGFPVLNSKLGLVARAIMQIPSRRAEYLNAVSSIANDAQLESGLVRSLDDRSRALEPLLGGPAERNRFLMLTQLLKRRLEARFAAVRSQVASPAPMDALARGRPGILGLRTRQAGQASDFRVRSPIDYGARFRSHFLAAESAPSPPPARLFQVRLEAPRGFLESLAWQSTNWVPVDVEIDGHHFDKAHLRLKGHGTRRDFRAKASFTLKFNKEAKGRAWLSRTKIHLHNALYDASYLNEFTGAWLFHRAGYPAPDVNFARVRVNDQDYGLYVLVEAAARPFLQRSFGHGGGILYEGDFGDLDSTLDLDHGQPAENDAGPLALYESGRRALEQRWIEPLSGMCDPRRLAAFVSLEVVLGHHDGYSLGTHNFRLYQGGPGAPFLLLPHGMDVLFPNAETGLFPPMKGVLARAITETPDGREMYLEQCRKVLAQALDLERYSLDAAFVCRLVQPVLREFEPLKAASQLESAQQLASVLGDRKATLLAELERFQRLAGTEPAQP